MKPEKSEAYVLAERLLSVVYRGNYHIPGKIKDCGHYAECNVLDPISTYDSNVLTRLVIAAHELRCRIEMRSSGPGRIKLRLSPRKRIEECGEFPIMEGHETIDNAVIVFRKNSRQQYLDRQKQEG